ncbi:MAG TPA: hypothetical protein VL326_12790 [Kofleriaceae bacterium]|nr:hypothetical protein [Kofleriaceae bacterium]
MRALVVLLMLAGTAHAQQSTVTVTLNPGGEMLAQNLGLSVQDLIDHAEAQIDELYKVSRIDQLLRAFANTAAFAQRGLTVDYNIDPGDVVVGVAGGGVHGDVAIGTTNSLLGGSIINFGAMTGVNLGRWNQRHAAWSVFGGGFYEQTTVHGLTGHLLTLGAHVQLQAVPAKARGHAHWTGVAITTGVEYAKWAVGEASMSTIESHFTATGPTEHATIHMSSTGTLDVLTTTYTVPVEVTTGGRFGFFGLYGGGGLSLTTGQSAITAQLSSVLSINHDHLPVGDAVITGSGENTPSPVSVHALVGTEIHTRHVRAFLQGAFAPGETAASLGVRGAF